MAVVFVFGYGICNRFYIFKLQISISVKVILSLMLVLYTSFGCIAQTDDDALTVRVLAMDTSVDIARRFCEKIAELAPGYNIAFIDNEKRYLVRYVYKNEKNESLRMDYGFDMVGDEEGKKAKKAVVDYQRISADLSIMTKIYNFLFNANVTPETIMATSTQGSPINFMGKTFEYSLLPDDYDPGYWVLTFRK